MTVEKYLKQKENDFNSKQMEKEEIRKKFGIETITETENLKIYVIKPDKKKE